MNSKTRVHAALNRQSADRVPIWMWYHPDTAAGLSAALEYVEGGDDVDLAPALELVERYRGVADTVRRAESHVARATAAIAPFPEGCARSDLLAAARFSVARDR